MMEKDWLDSLKDRMESYEESTPEGLWDSISSAVGKQGKKRSTTILPWVWRTAAAAAAVAVCVLVSRLSSDDTTPNQIIDNSVALQENQAVPTDVPNPSSSVYSEGDGRTASECAIVKSQSGRKDLLAQAEISQSTDPGRDVQSEPGIQSLAEAEAGAPVVIEQGPVEPQKQDDEAPVYIPDNVTSHDGEDWSDRMSAGDEPRRSPFIVPSSVETSFSGAVTDSKDVAVFNPSSFYRGAAPSNSSSEDQGSGTSSENSMQKISINNLPSVTNTTKHDRPIRAAVTARWKFGNVLGIETGGEWTMLRSTFSTTSGNTVNETVQTLQYVGIPLNLTADMFNAGRFSVYLSAGAMAEKCISAKKQERVLVSGDVVNSLAANTFVVDPILYSLNASAGAQLRLLGNFGLYFEPGLSYHFDDGSDVETIYKERPLDFVMTFGLRYNFK